MVVVQPHTGQVAMLQPTRGSGAASENDLACGNFKPDAHLLKVGVRPIVNLRIFTLLIKSVFVHKVANGALVTKVPSTQVLASASPYLTG